MIVPPFMQRGRPNPREAATHQEISISTITMVAQALAVVSKGLDHTTFANLSVLAASGYRL